LYKQLTYPSKFEYAGLLGDSDIYLDFNSDMKYWFEVNSKSLYIKKSN
jgi:hypothetical protein